METEKLTMSVSEAAKLSGIGRNKLYQLARSDSFPALRLGKSIRIPRRAFEEWIEQAAKERTYESILARP